MKKKFEANKKSETRDTTTISSKKPLFLFWFTWAIALIASCQNLEVVVFFPFFPMGLAKQFNIEPSNLVLGIGWLIYTILGIAIFSVRKKKTFLIIYLTFVVLLIFNVAGCRSIQFS